MAYVLMIQSIIKNCTYIFFFKFFDTSIAEFKFRPAINLEYIE